MGSDALPSAVNAGGRREVVVADSRAPSAPERRAGTPPTCTAGFPHPASSALLLRTAREVPSFWGRGEEDTEANQGVPQRWAQRCWEADPGAQWEVSNRSTRDAKRRASLVSSAHVLGAQLPSPWLEPPPAEGTQLAHSSPDKGAEHDLFDKDPDPFSQDPRAKNVAMILETEH